MEWWGGGLKEMSAGGSESQSNLNWAQTFIYVHAILFVGYATLSSLTKKKKKRQEQLSIGLRVLKRPTHSALLLF
jgi:hypothetical protein